METQLLIKKGKKQYLVQTRLKDPFFGYHGYVTGKIRWGEKILEAAKRELLEETGMTAENFDKEPFRKFDGGENLWFENAPSQTIDSAYN